MTRYLTFLFFFFAMWGFADGVQDRALAEVWHKNAPHQVIPGIKEIQYDKFNTKTGLVEKSTVKYDQFGRQIERIDYTDHGMPYNHTNPHTHKYEYNKNYPLGHKIK